MRNYTVSYSTNLPNVKPNGLYMLNFTPRDRAHGRNQMVSNFSYTEVRHGLFFLVSCWNSGFSLQFFNALVFLHAFIWLVYHISPCLFSWLTYFSPSSFLFSNLISKNVFPSSCLDLFRGRFIVTNWWPKRYFGWGGEEYDKFSHDVFSDMGCLAICLQCLEKNKCKFEEMYTKISQLLHLPDISCQIIDEHCGDMTNLMHQQGFYESHRIMRAFSQPVGNTTHWTLSSKFGNVDGPKLVNSRCILVIVDGRHHSRAIGRLKEEKGIMWTEEWLSEHHVICMKAGSIQTAKEVNLIKPRSNWNQTGRKHVVCRHSEGAG